MILGMQKKLIPNKNYTLHVDKDGTKMIYMTGSHKANVTIKKYTNVLFFEIILK